MDFISTGHRATLELEAGLQSGLAQAKLKRMSHDDLVTLTIQLLKNQCQHWRTINAQRLNEWEANPAR